MLEYAAGCQPELVLLIGNFRRRLVRQCEYASPLIRISVELNVRAFLHIRIKLLSEAPRGFLSVDDGPAQAARLVIGVKGREVVTTATAELRIFLKQPFLKVETECPGLVILVLGIGIANGIAIDRTVDEQHLEQAFAAVSRMLVQHRRGPDFIRFEAFRKFDDLPQIRAGVVWRRYQLMPEVRTPLPAAESALLLDPHRGWEDEVGRSGGHGRIDIRDNDKGRRVAVSGIAFLVEVGRRLDIV